MKKALSWLKYFVYLGLIVLVVWVKPIAETSFQTQYSETYKINYLLYVVLVLIPVIIGALIGLEIYFNERAREGKWRFNLPKLILLGIPSLYITAFYFISLIPSEKVYNILVVPIYGFFGNTSDFIMIFQLLLGYSLITLFYKSDRVKETVIEEDKLFEEVYEKESDVDSEPVEGIVASARTQSEEASPKDQEAAAGSDVSAFDSKSEDMVK